MAGLPSYKTPFQLKNGPSMHFWKNAQSKAEILDEIGRNFLIETFDAAISRFEEGKLDDCIDCLLGMFTEIPKVGANTLDYLVSCKFPEFLLHIAFSPIEFTQKSINVVFGCVSDLCGRFAKCTELFIENGLLTFSINYISSHQSESNACIWSFAHCAVVDFPSKFASSVDIASVLRLVVDECANRCTEKNLRYPSKVLADLLEPSIGLDEESCIGTIQAITGLARNFFGSDVPLALSNFFLHGDRVKRAFFGLESESAVFSAFKELADALKQKSDDEISNSEKKAVKGLLKMIATIAINSPIDWNIEGFPVEEALDMLFLPDQRIGHCAARAISDFLSLGPSAVTTVSKEGVIAKIMDELEFSPFYRKQDMANILLAMLSFSHSNQRDALIERGCLVPVMEMLDPLSEAKFIKNMWAFIDNFMKEKKYWRITLLPYIYQFKSIADANIDECSELYSKLLDELDKCDDLNADE